MPKYLIIYTRSIPSHSRPFSMILYVMKIEIIKQPIKIATGSSIIFTSFCQILAFHFGNRFSETALLGSKRTSLERWGWIKWIIIIAVVINRIWVYLFSIILKSFQKVLTSCRTLIILTRCFPIMNKIRVNKFSFQIEVDGTFL